MHLILTVCISFTISFIFSMFGKGGGEFYICVFIDVLFLACPAWWRRLEAESDIRSGGNCRFSDRLPCSHEYQRAAPQTGLCRNSCFRSIVDGSEAHFLLMWFL